MRKGRVPGSCFVSIPWLELRTQIRGFGRNVRSTRDARGFSEAGAHFRIHGPAGESIEVLLPMSGLHNLENGTMTYSAGLSLGSRAGRSRGFANFAGVKRRQEPRGENGGVLVIDDFANHPTAVREPSLRSLSALFQPRSNTSRRIKARYPE